MTKAPILSLVNSLANFPIDGDLLDVYYDDVLVELGRMTNTPLTANELQPVVANTHTYSIPDKMISILHAFHSSKSLISSRTQDVDAYVNEWRDDTGTPFTVLIDELSGKTYRLFPIPDTSSDDFFFITGTPMGTDFPDNAVTLIYSELRDDDILDFLGLIIALQILSREFIRQSDHRDVLFAQSCNDVAKLMLTFIGIEEAK